MIVRSRRSVAVLKAHNYAQWCLQENRAGDIGPYGVEHLNMYDLAPIWSDGLHSPVFGFPGVRRIRAALASRPWLAGLDNAVVSWSKVREAAAVLSIFEDQGCGALALKQSGLGIYAKRPHIAIVCWATERIKSLPQVHVRKLVSVLNQADAIVVFSANQLDELAGVEGLNSENVHVCRFGVDVDFFSKEQSHPDGVGFEMVDVVSIGRDSSRDYKTLCDAVRGRDVRVKIVCGESNLTGLDVPENVQVITSGVDHAEYRAIMKSAKVVVVPTSAPSYPSGQTVFLEAMAARRAVVTTDSVAVRDYIEDGTTALLYKNSDPENLWAKIDILLRDGDRRLSVSRAAYDVVSTRFRQLHMWQDIGAVVLRVMERAR